MSVLFGSILHVFAGKINDLEDFNSHCFLPCVGWMISTRCFEILRGRVLNLWNNDLHGITFWVYVLSFFQRDVITLNQMNIFWIKDCLYIVLSEKFANIFVNLTCQSIRWFYKWLLYFYNFPSYFYIFLSTVSSFKIANPELLSNSSNFYTRSPCLMFFSNF